MYSIGQEKCSAVRTSVHPVQLCTWNCTDSAVNKKRYFLSDVLFCLCSHMPKLLMNSSRYQNDGTTACTDAFSLAKCSRTHQAHLVGRGLAQLRNLFHSGDSRSIPNFPVCLSRACIYRTPLSYKLGVSSGSDRQIPCWTSWF